MIILSNEIATIRSKLNERDLYIYDIVELAFSIKKLSKIEGFDLSALINISPKIEWENFNRVLPFLPKKIAIERLDELLEGFMDLNWPGSRILYGYLAEMDIEPLKNSFSRVIRKAIDLDDSDWVYFLLVFMESDRVDLQSNFLNEIEICRKYLTENGIELD